MLDARVQQQASKPARVCLCVWQELFGVITVITVRYASCAAGASERDVQYEHIRQAHRRVASMYALRHSYLHQWAIVINICGVAASFKRGTHMHLRTALHASFKTAGGWLCCLQDPCSSSSCCTLCFGWYSCQMLSIQLPYKCHVQ